MVGQKEVQYYRNIIDLRNEKSRKFNFSQPPQLTRDFIVSSNHLYVFIVLSFLGVVAYQKTPNINFVIIYLFLSSIILELFHAIIPAREYEWADLFGNILGVIFVFIIYKVKDKYDRI